MASMLDKVLTFLGVRGEEEEELEIHEEEIVDEPVLPRKPMRRGNLVSLDGGSKQVRVMIIEPLEFEEVRTYVDHLRNKHPLIVRVTNVDVDEAQRIVDFMSGATYAVNGNMRKLGEKIFFFAPESISIEGELEPSIFDLREFSE